MSLSLSASATTVVRHFLSDWGHFFLAGALALVAAIVTGDPDTGFSLVGVELTLFWQYAQDVRPQHPLANRHVFVVCLLIPVATLFLPPYVSNGRGMASVLGLLSMLFSYILFSRTMHRLFYGQGDSNDARLEQVFQAIAGVMGVLAGALLMQYGE